MSKYVKKVLIKYKKTDIINKKEEMILWKEK